jgi:threonine dehydratase
MPTFDDVVAAAARIKPVAVKTPLIESPALNELLGGRLFLKCEMLQKTGSFKFRGAYNAIKQLTEEQKKNGVFAFSSGNHAQGIAYAAKLLGTTATILMPNDTPAVKVQNTKNYGGVVVQYDRYTESRDDIGAKIASDNNLTPIKPFDNEAVIAGQGTIGLEVADQLNDLGLRADILAAPCGGGGMLAGIAIALANASPETKIYSSEPEHFDDLQQSLARGEITSNPPGYRSICDAILTPEPGQITFPILKNADVTGVNVTDGDAKAAVKTAYEYFKVVTEPGGAVALAAFLKGKIDLQGKVVVAVVSGGNIDNALFLDILSAE